MHDVIHRPTAIISLSARGAVIGNAIAAALTNAQLYVHEIATSDCPFPHKAFSRVTELTAELFSTTKQFVYILPCGVAVRALAPHIVHKLSDPAIAVVDVAGRWVTSLLSGHEGGANDLCLHIANTIGAEPIITTTTEAEKTIIVGVGCRKDTPAAEIESFILEVLDESGFATEDVRYLATAEIKKDEPGLVQAATALGIPLRIIAHDAIRGCTREITESSFVQEKVNLPAVAEPCALLAGSRTELICPRKAKNGVTVALARERCMW